ncbi:MAG: apolipoprotein N-acyltransferase [Kangiellaceae bacterium]|nr:apolipoprotein N-acyltransferase [Kangiellaceae bacterium]
MQPNLSLLPPKSVWLQRLILVIFGALYPLGFSPIDWWPLTFVSLLLLFNELTAAVVRFQQQELNTSLFRALFGTIFYWSIGAFGLGVSWVYVSIHEFGHVPMLGAVAISFLLVLTLSVIKGGSAYFIGKLVSGMSPGALIVIIPFIWVLFEFVQTFIFSGFPWLFAGYTQIDGPMWKLSTWLGVYGVSWFLAAIGSCLVFIMRGWCVEPISNVSKDDPDKLKEQGHFSSGQRALYFVLVVLLSVPLLASIVDHQSIDSSKEHIQVALVQPNIPQQQKWDRRYFSQIMRVLYQQSELHWDADLIVWPEGAIPAYEHQVVDILDDLNKKARGSKTDLMLGLPVYFSDDNISYSALMALGDSKQSYHKQVLVPFGEYVPLGSYLRGVIEFLNLPMSSFSPATKEQTVFDFADYQVIPAICYEITYPGIVHRLTANADNSSSKAKLLVTVSNDAWFGDSLGPYQHMQMARMRALELGIPLVRSTNDGITAVVDAKGGIVKSLPRYQQQTLRFEVPLKSYLTPYRNFGLFGIYLILTLNGLIIVFALYRRKTLLPRAQTV